MRIPSALNYPLEPGLLAMLKQIDPVAYNRLAANYIDEDGQLRTESRAGTGDSAGQLGLFRGGEDDS